MFIEMCRFVNQGGLYSPRQAERLPLSATSSGIQIATDRWIIAAAAAIWRQFARYRLDPPRSIDRRRSEKFAQVPGQPRPKNLAGRVRGTRHPGSPSDR